MTAVMRCVRKCEHVFQDKVYGKGMRVHNGGAKVWRCTVYKNERTK